jgi:hypothetical protein
LTIFTVWCHWVAVVSATNVAPAAFTTSHGSNGGSTMP